MKKKAKCEKELDDLRLCISRQKDISMEKIYIIFNPLNSEIITQKEFIKICHKLNIGLSQEELSLVFNRLNKNMDGKLTYQDICDIFVPIQNIEFLNRKSSNESIETESLDLIKSIIQKYVEVESNNIKWKKRLTNDDPKILFAKFDIEKKNYITIADVRNIFLQIGRKISSET